MLVSCVTGEGIGALCSELQAAAQAALQGSAAGADGGMVTRQRHRQLLQEAAEALRRRGARRERMPSGRMPSGYRADAGGTWWLRARMESGACEMCGCARTAHGQFCVRAAPGLHLTASVRRQMWA